MSDTADYKEAIMAAVARIFSVDAGPVRQSVDDIEDTVDALVGRLQTLEAALEQIRQYEDRYDAHDPADGPFDFVDALWVCVDAARAALRKEGTPQ